MSPVDALAFASIDWSAPWLAPYRGPGRRVAGHIVGRGAGVAEALNLEADPRVPVTFVPPPAGTPEAYEAFIARTRQVPTRDNLHDFFNGLVWLVFPEIKAHLNRLQAEQIQNAGGVAGPRRGPVRDALTLFDENAAIVEAPPMLLQALTRRDWRRLFVERRAEWQRARVTVFGHALLEKLMQPRKAITAHAWVTCCEDGHGQGEVATLEARVVAQLTAERLAGKSHRPLPVLGVPGWWPANAAPAFYDDETVFRPLRE